jgi:hypothetical protein
MRKIRSECPARHCGAAAPVQHRQDPDVLIALGFSEPWIEDAQRCAYCGTIWSFATDGSKTEQGYFDAAGHWHDAKGRHPSKQRHA